jgi:UDP-galactopyranose mutase
MEYDYVIVGAGFFGSICAYELTKMGKKVLVLENRNHIGGNCYTENKNGINVHMYGPHIFHTSNDEIWNWINQFVSFNNFILTPVANFEDELYSLPFNMWTFNKIFNVKTPSEALYEINKQGEHILDPKNFEEQAIKLVGVEVYEKLIKGYTTKQWKKDPKDLPKEIIKRLPVRFTFNNNYFNDKYQGIPIGGYTKIFEKLLENVEVKLNVNYLDDKNYWDSITDKIIYTGPIDKFYNYKFGELEYKTTNFEHKLIKEVSNFQGVAVMNFTSVNIPYTRIIEHKHFENVETDSTWITYETPIDFDAKKTEAYYPVNDAKNNAIYLNYKNLTINEKKVIFGGRLAEYKYYDMHNIIESALNLVNTIRTYE